jgi:TolB-like protein
MADSYCFDRFELRPTERILLVEGTPVALGSRAFDLLLCLVLHRDRVLSKDEVLEHVWPGQVVEENNLSVHVSALRKILGAAAITTVSGRGYRFTLDMHPAKAREPSPVAAQASERPTIAVLPLNVLSDEPRLAFFAQGLVEDVTALLARVPGFILISHASSSVFRNQQAPFQDVARQLGVRFLVQGSVRPKGEVLRVSLQLIEAASARILWSAQFDSKADEAADAQENIARGIISELEPELTRAEISHIRRQRPENLDAWSHYHEAVGALATKGWSADGMASARLELRRSTNIDPNFGLSHGQYALLTILASNIGMVPDTPELRADVLASVNSAIALDDGSSEVLGYAGCALCDMGHHKRGVDTLQQALQLNPSNAQAHVAMGAALAMTRKFDEGIDRMRYGMKISPRDRRLGFWGWVLGRFLLRADRVEEALVEARLACRVDPRFHLPHVLQAASLDRLAATNDAIAALNAARQRRSELSPEEVMLTHGRRVSERLALIWDRAA